MTVEEWLGKDNQLGIDIWNKKYRYNDETFDEWLDRVSGHNDDIKRLIVEKKFLFGGRILANRELPNVGVKTTYSNCYVLSVDDSIESIYRSCGEIARTYSYGGGVGIDISNLRPRGAVVHNSAKATTGAVSFMKTFDTVTGTIGQNGRRGALMISLSVNHPDIDEFIDIKANTDQITNANISVRVTDDFMKAVENDKDYILKWPCDKTPVAFDEKALEYNKLVTCAYVSDPFSSKSEGVAYVKKVKARDLFHKLAKNNWDFGEPGLLYWSTIESGHLMSKNKNFKYAGVNPCAEEPLCDGGACLLGSINLSAYDNPLTDDNFADDVRLATIALNNVLEEGRNLHPLQKQVIACEKYNQIGLGILGLGDLLIKNELVYGSQDACNYAKSIMKKILINAFITSCDLNKDQKIKYEGLFDSDFYQKEILPFLPEHYKYVYPKNSQLLTIAPTGTISTMIQTSGGAEPVFAFKYYRTTKSLHGHDETYEVYHPLVEKYLSENTNYTIETLPEWFVTAEEIPIYNRIAMQSALQTQIDASISSTANLNEKASIEDVENLYIEAWKQKLKGITVFRSNCKRIAILSTKKSQNNQDPTRKAPKRPKILEADWYQVVARGQIFNVYIGLLEGKPYEIFAKPTFEKNSITNGHGKITKQQKGVYSWFNDKEEGVISDSNIAIMEEDSPERVATLLASLGLRHGADIKYIVKTLKKTNPLISSFTAAMIRVLNKYNTDDSPVEDKCPECGATLTRSGGCIHCDSCGYSKCMALMSSNIFNYEILPSRTRP